MGCKGIRGPTGARAVGTKYPHIHRLAHPLPGPHPQSPPPDHLDQEGGLTTNEMHSTISHPLSNQSGPPLPNVILVLATDSRSPLSTNTSTPIHRRS